MEIDLEVTADHIAAIQRGSAYRELEASGGYKQLLDYLEKRNDEALKALRQSDLLPDMVKLNLQLIWREREKLLEDIQIEVQRGIRMGRETAMELDRNAAGSYGLPLSFDDGENN